MELAVNKAWEWRRRLVSQQETSRFDKIHMPQMGLILQNQHFLANSSVRRNSSSCLVRVHSESSTWKTNLCLQTSTSLVSPLAYFYLSLPVILAGTDCEWCVFVV